MVDCVRTTLGPRGMDKLIVEANGRATISNDGATIMKLLDVVHPAAKTLVDIAKSQVKINQFTFRNSNFLLQRSQKLKACKIQTKVPVHCHWVT